MFPRSRSCQILTPPQVALAYTCRWSALFRSPKATMPPTPSQPRPRPARFGGLDGLRALAVGLVLVYHLFPRALPGGFLGVDIFFVISGFLITSLLLHEYQTRGRIGLGAFWRRRARRLLPALAIVLLVTTSLAALGGGDLLVGVGRQLAGTAFFVSNWLFISQGANYFERDTPELFRNTWSLSIEEQFYIVLPLLILLLTRLRGRSTRAIILGSLGITSAALMAWLSLQGGEPTRVYFGSDTHTFGLFWGAALAALVQPAPTRGRITASPAGAARNADSAHLAAAALRPPGFGRTWGTAALAVLSLGVLGWLAVTLPEGSPESFEWGFQLATGAAVLLVWAVTRPGVAVGRALDVQPLRWVGERSYGLYLWHWPLLLIFTEMFPGAHPALVPVITLLATFGAAALSFTYVEQPVRRFGVRRSLSMLVRGAAHTPRQRTVAIAIGALCLVTVPGVAYAVATAPAQSSAAAAIERGQQALDKAQAAPPETSEPPAAKSADPEQKTHRPGPVTQGPEAPPRESSAPPAPLLPQGHDITAVGDSVMLASLPELEEAFPGIFVDAAVSRGMGAGVELTTEWANAGELRSVLIVGLGTNGPVAAEELDQMYALAGAEHPMALVNAHAERDWIPGVNAELARFAEAHRGVVVADWTGAVAGVPDALAGDDIHPNPSGGEIYAGAITAALLELQEPGEAIGFALPRR